ncbi:Nitrilase and fragile histidine triad fusion protein NitFhit [Orchesella cincta]|uniref:Nitrilase and fragile histidine triad fusion protein NitFhit n=1 Tax=Orchesella cincta TaxID=48709 RepID=A0A1D2MIM5_ORCCI|nr:Nitrilase and fragile histidine triad fusion protein NitFhit [Orchesella cincta]
MKSFSMLRSVQQELRFLFGFLRNYHSTSPNNLQPLQHSITAYNKSLWANCRNFRTKMGSEGLKPVTVACIQLCCTEDKTKNFETARSLICQAKEKNAKMIFLPEAFDYIGRSKEESAQLSETLDGPLITSYRNLAKELKVWLSLGGFHEKQTELRDGLLPWMTNNHVLIDCSGEIKSVYRKVHLFDVVIPEDNVNLKESSFIRGGNEIMKPEKTLIGNLGLGICYDVRFPEFSLSLRKMGADVLTYPSAFTVPTGQAHWETLLRARAIETQCFVIAAAQTGQHNPKRASYGHSLIVDPWGRILADAKDDVGIITAELDLNQVASVRKKMPVISHRQAALYGNTITHKYSIPTGESDNETFSFGHVSVKMNAVFLESELSRAFVNKKCVVPGHVLISSKRVAMRLCDLSPSEISDIFTLAQKVQTIMEAIHGASSSTITVQDGKDAGQTVQHVHIHVLPRKENDFKENDEIYERLGDHDKGNNNIKWREESEMIIECNQIRDHIMQNHVNILRN